ncbi:Protein-tyrosine phosphatase [Ancylostoma duodenale]|uniref:Protein-tyrosine phosphatase n=1 Tax=Ancylostoma duodenale TaxID=51022 RepID=A0A0C2FGG4_9BILA|nr:Protein-tyrosine phosphatase [Ancylostoma duodenale]
MYLQAPMSNTLIDWFRMIWQLKIAIVVCLTDPENPACCEPYFKLRENQTLKVKNRFVVRTISVREEDGGITNYHLRLTNKLSSEKNRTLYVIAMPTSATSSLGDGTEVPPVLVHGCYGVSRTAAFVATYIMCKSLQTRGEMSPMEVWARLNHARHNAAKERVHFLSSIECALLFSVDIGLLSANNPQLIEVNKMLRQSYDEELKKERPASASREQ